ncbi:MAG: hypothetical protein N5P05_004601 (plasmid) [Chroococcopsis gigantea SAG 12.99]|jgi:type 2 lantibiotic biosynthesis protein LanM|nr:hypothetical protein [Chroococcopsis gigantea SAG 12.99]
MNKDSIPEGEADIGDIINPWMKALGTNDPDYFQRRLLWDGVSITNANVFLQSLSRSEISDRFFVIQDWLRNSTRIDELDQKPEELHLSFVELWERIASGGMKELAKSLPQEVAAYYHTEYERWDKYKDIYKDLNDDLVTKLSVIGEPVLWDEFNTRRTPAQIILAHLGADGSGKGPPKRTIYCSFLEELRSDCLESITKKYPVLKRHLSTIVEHWLEYSREILTRVYNDHPLLFKTFDLPIDAKLTAIRQNLSDPHRSGRTVAILTFTSVSNLSKPYYYIVYKPKDLGLDYKFQGMLSELPLPKPEDNQLRSITVIAQTGYGYMEWIPHNVCTSEHEIRSFYRNAGRLTAILHLLGCTDCHHENLIACKDHLILIDAETLFEGIANDHDKDTNSFRVETSLQKQIGNSVIRLGLLPQWYFVGKQRILRDVSALGIQPPQSQYQQAVGWLGLNSDGMIAGEIKKPAYLPTSLPVGIGSVNRLGDFVEEFCDGFKGQLIKILEDKHQWLGDNGLLTRFEKCQRRFVPRPTWLYLWLQKQQIEPVSLLSEVNQRLILENLARSYLIFITKPNNWPMFVAEVAQMEKLDIPFFEQSIKNLEFVLPNGLTIDNFFEISGYENARQKLQQLNSSSINLQVKLIRGVITAKNRNEDHGTQPYFSLSSNLFLEELSAEDRFSEAKVIGDLLVGTSITYDKGSVEWLGIDLTEIAEISKYGPLGLSLYSGRSGIALFLATLAQRNIINSDIYRQTALGACSDLKKLLVLNRGDHYYRWWRDQPLGLAGSGGILLALIHIKELLPDLEDVVNYGLSSLLNSLDVNLIRSDQQLDIIHGCAGLIGPLLKIGSSKALLLAQEAGNNLVNRQDACGGWVISNIGATALTGFSHGASGMSAGLARLHSLTGQSKYVEAATRALLYERKIFDLAKCNWPDFRGNYNPKNPRFMLSWCHGAPGIALSRLCMSNTSLWDASAKEELDYALGSTANQQFAGDSLCCGRFGRAAILRLGARDGNEPKWLEAAVQLEKQSLNMKRANGGYSFLDMPGFFTGSAGVGLALLDSISGENCYLLPSILSGGLYEQV